MEGFSSKQQLVDYEDEVIERKDEKQTSCCRLFYSVFVLAAVTAAVIFTLMVLTDLMKLAEYPGNNQLDSRATYVIFDDTNASPRWQHRGKYPVYKHRNQDRVHKFNPPPFFEKAKTARYIVHASDWSTLVTTSVHLKGAPFGVPQSVSDGPISNATGVPYLYVTSFATIMEDIRANPVVSLTYSEAQSDYCKEHSWDPEYPRCARLCLTGKIAIVPKGSAEETFARTALFTRHPSMKQWPKSHDWLFIKLNITNIWLLDFFGKGSEVAVKDYFNARP